MAQCAYIESDFLNVEYGKHIQLVEQYTDLKELNARILNRLISKILVRQRGVDEDAARCR